MKDQCETNDQCCSSESCGCESQSSECCGSSSCGGDSDPLDKAVHAWIGAFFQAKHELQVELLKSRIQKAWGPKMEKSADAVFETVEAIFKAMTSRAEAKGKLREKLRAIYEQK